MAEKGDICDGLQIYDAKGEKFNLISAQTWFVVGIVGSRLVSFFLALLLLLIPSRLLVQRRQTIW